MGNSKFSKRNESLRNQDVSRSNKFTENMIMIAENRDIDKYYEIKCKLSEGSMGSVSKAVKKKQKAGGSAYSDKPQKKMKGRIKSRPSFNVQKEYAIKSIVHSRISPEFIEELWNEIEILQKIDHPNVVKAFEVYGSKRNIYIVMEFCSGGDLYARLPYTEKESAKIIGKLLSAVAYMHEKGVVHRDIKFENIMFESKAEDAEIKVLDFGLSKKFSDGKLGHMTEGVGTIYTMAPEVIRGIYSSQADLWSVGVLAYMLLCHCRPFGQKNRKAMIQAIKNCKYSFNQDIWKQLSPESKKFVSELIVLDPKKRLTAKSALQHDWQLKEFDLSRRDVDKELMKRIGTKLKEYGQVSELKKMALMVLAHQSTTEEICDLRKTFDQYDSSNVGRITLDEFKSILMESHYSEAEIEELFSKIDVAQNNEIDYSEFIAATLEAQGAIEELRLAEAFDRIDSDDTGFISRQNLRDMLGESYTEALVDGILEEADENKDGVISFDEFMKSFQKNKNLNIRQSVFDIQLTEEQLEELKNVDK